MNGYLQLSLSFILIITNEQEEVVRKTQAFERLKVEAEKCLTQSERFNSEKAEFEDAIYAKVFRYL